jgi:response regulator NasT
MSASVGHSCTSARRAVRVAGERRLGLDDLSLIDDFERPFHGRGSEAADAVVERVAACPVIAPLSAKDPAYVREAAKRGVFAYIVDRDSDELQSAIDITLQRFAEYQSLQGASAGAP